MLFPSRTTELTITDRQGIEIGFCSKGWGVWLDRGELDEIVERSGVAMRGSAPRSDSAAARGQPWPDDGRDEDWVEDRHRRYGQQGYRQPGSPRHKKSWLGDLFDLD